MWNDGDDRLEIVLGKLLVGDIKEYPLECPICNEKALNFYLIKRVNKINGGVWMWCSNCRNFTHGTAKIPEWWENCNKIDIEMLTSLPLYQERNKMIIKKHVKDLLDL